MGRCMYAPVRPAVGGFGMYERGEVEYAIPEWDGPSSFEEEKAIYLSLPGDGEVSLRTAPELDGRIYNQNNAEVWAWLPEEGEEFLFLLWEEEEKA